jgi:predicted nucleotidyltransferase/HEPN domain-containing protein
MKRSLAHLPKQKREELKAVVSIIREMVPTTEMVILFGSHARGDWVDDTYREGGVVYEYKSDFDILVVTNDKKTVKNDALWYQLEERIGYNPTRTPVSIIKHHIKDLNQKIEDRFYFFTDLKKEGIWLFNSGNYKLSRARRFSPGELRKSAEVHFQSGFKKAAMFFEDFDFNIQKGTLDKRYLCQAAFMLHQSTEHAYHTILLVFTGYKPKTHHLGNPGKRVASLNPEFMKVFPQKTEEEKHLFKLLKKAYVEARYNDKYRITKKELEYLAGRVKKLHAMAKRICREKIEGFR